MFEIRVHWTFFPDVEPGMSRQGEAWCNLVYVTLILLSLEGAVSKDQSSQFSIN